MLTRIYIDNDRCFSNFEWKPGKLVLLGGRNGAGKSSLFNILRKLRALVYRGATVAEQFPRSDLTRWDSRPIQTYEVDLTVAQTSYLYTLEIDHGSDADQPPMIRTETLRGPKEAVYQFDGEVNLLGEDGTRRALLVADASRSPLHALPELPYTKLLTQFKEAFGRCWWAAPLPPTFEAESTKEVLEPDVRLSNFVSWYRTASGDSIKTTQLVEHLRPVIEGLRGLKLERTGRTARVLQAVFSDAAQNGRAGATTTFDFDELSDGQRALVALYSLLVFGPLDDGLLCIDEPDNFVGLSEIEPWLRALEDRVDEGDGQVFLASHNPEVINRLWEGHGVILERDPRGPVRVREMDTSSGLPPAEIVARGIE